MKQIEKLSEQIEEEMHDAEKYIKCALRDKDMDAKLARVYYELSQDEMQHADKLHGEVVEIIGEYRARHGEPPAQMQWVYDYLHDKHIERAKDIRKMQEEF